MFSLSMSFLLLFSTNQANAAVGSKDLEMDVNFGCTVTLPGGVVTDPTFFPLIIKASIPNWVAPNQDFHLTNTSIEIIIPEDLPPSFFPIGSMAESPIFKLSSENTTTSIMKGPFSYQEIPRPGEGSLFIPNEAGGVEVGPFRAGEDGHVIIKADEVGMNVNIGLPVAFTCKPHDEENALIATIPIDNEAPVITLNGDNPLTMKQGDSFKDPGATAEDNFDGKVSERIEISGDVDTNTVGTYILTYTVSDSVGNETSVERTVNVVEPFGSWYTGEGPPSDHLGSNGDSYLDVTTGDIYKRDPNTWTKIGNLKGNDGKQGSSIHTGSNAPKADTGNIGDLYLDTKTGDVFEKNANGWEKIANLQGPQGPKGDAGSGGGNSKSGDHNGKQPNTGNKKVTTKGDTNSKATTGGKLPKTASSLPTLILIGAIFTTMGGILLLRRKKAIEKPYSS